MDLEVGKKLKEQVKEMKMKVHKFNKRNHWMGLLSARDAQNVSWSPSSTSNDMLVKNLNLNIERYSIIHLATLYNLFCVGNAYYLLGVSFQRLDSITAL